MDSPDLLRLPEGLPVPVDDGAASHLPGRAMPALSLPATDGRQVALDALGSGRTVVYIYPMTGRPGVDLPEGWDDIPGARGCTPESCAFRNLYADLQTAGAAQVFGLSSQPTDYQAEAWDRLTLRSPCCSMSTWRWWMRWACPRSPPTARRSTAASP